jgi:hypothetical protein
MVRREGPKTIRSRSITGKFSQDEYSVITERAASLGFSVSEYARRQILDGLTLRPDTRFIAAELLAFQEVFLALILASLKGDLLNESRISDLRARFGAVKSALVDQALEQFQSTTSRSL